jgi:hypothetical protein
MEDERKGWTFFTRGLTFALIMVTVRTSGTSAYFIENTRRFFLESCHLHMPS